MRYLFFSLIFTLSLFSQEFKIIDSHNSALQNATIFCGDKLYTSNDLGIVTTEKECKPILKTYGYRGIIEHENVIRATKFEPRGLFVSFYGISSRLIMDRIYDLVDKGIINTLVIEIKSDDGQIAFANDIDLAKESGANNILTIKNINALIEKLQAKGVYTVAKIALFKDGRLPIKYPELAIKKPSGELFRDKQKVTWSDPFIKKVQDYNLDVIKLTIDAGFDEIMLDYARFPDHNGLKYAKESTKESRIATIEEFLARSKELTDSSGAFLSAAIFGYTAWNPGDVGIGQSIETIGAHVDFLSPMLYPSGFSFGIPGHKNPMLAQYETVYKSLEQSIKRSRLDPIRFRPWLQSFRDYAFDRRQFGLEEVKMQIEATNDSKSGGWYLWNPRNSYTSIEGENTKERLTLR